MLDLGLTFRDLWPLWAMFVVAVVIVTVQELIRSWGRARRRRHRQEEKRVKQKRLPAVGRFEDIDSLSGEDFERLLARLFYRKGYQVEFTPRTEDYGVDLILCKDNRRIAVQAKRYSPDRKITNKQVRELAGGRDYYGCQVGLLITTSYFTAPAKEQAKVNDIVLWDRDRLARELKWLRGELYGTQSKTGSE